SAGDRIGESDSPPRCSSARRAGSQPRRPCERTSCPLADASDRCRAANPPESQIGRLIGESVLALAVPYAQSGRPVRTGCLLARVRPEAARARELPRRRARKASALRPSLCDETERVELVQECNQRRTV